MKNFLLSFLSFSFITSSISAQITLNQTVYVSSPIGIDTLKKTSGSSALPSFLPALNGTWDLTVVTNTVDTMLTYKVPALSPATFADSNGLFFGTAQYQGNVQRAITVAGLMEYGVKVDSAAFEIASMAGDTLFILKENSMYTPTTSPRTIIKFPGTIGSSWSSSYESDFYYELSYLLSLPSPSYDHAPGIIKSFYTETDTVIGWGKMRVLTITGAASGYMNVLQVRTQISRIDTVYLNGGITDPGLPALLSLLGATQGQVTKTFTQSFYRVNEITPLAYVVFIDSANNFPQTATTHVQRLAPGSIIADVGFTNTRFVNVYPNPVNNRTISVDVPTAQGEWKYELENVVGQIVETGAMQMSNGHAQILLPAMVNSGTYYIRIINDGRQVVVKPLEIK